MAIFEIGMAEYDSTFVIMPFAEAQAYFNLDDEASAIEVYLANADMVDTLRPAIETAINRQALITDWQQRNVTFFSALEVERNVMFLILTLIVLVAALNIISGLIMLVKDKGHDIAILRTMGATRGSIMRVFFIAGASIGTLGTLAGFILGVAILPQRRADPPVHLAPHADGAVLAGALFPEPASSRDGRARDHDGHHHGAGAVVPGDALPGVAGGAARSGRGAALRMSTTPQRQGRKPVLRLAGVERHYPDADRRTDRAQRRRS